MRQLNFISLKNKIIVLNTIVLWIDRYILNSVHPRQNYEWATHALIKSKILSTFFFLISIKNALVNF